MEIYISEAFLNHLSKLWESVKNDFPSEKNSNLLAVTNLISALPFKSDITQAEVERVILENKGSKFFSSIKELIVSSKIRDNQKLVTDFNLAEIENFSAYYFLNSESERESKLGVVVKDNEFDGSSFYNDCTVTDLAIPEKGGWSFLKENITPCNAMLIIDRYIFGGSFELKLRSLIDFITLHKKNIQIPFHLSLIFSSEFKASKQPPLSADLIGRAFDKIKSLGNIECELIIENREPYHDRLVFTNYTSGNIGLPFTDGPTRFNQNFLGCEISSEKIKRNYTQYKRDLKNWKNIIEKVPFNIGLQKTKWKSSEFQNRIFNVL